MTTVIELPSKIDHSAVEQLMENLKSNDGKPTKQELGKLRDG